MKNKSFVFLILIIALSSGSSAKDTERVWIFFKDKEPVKSKNIDVTAKRYLTEKAIERRLKQNLKTKFDFTDLPVKNIYVKILKENGVQIIHRSKWLNAVSALIKNSEFEKILALKFVSKIESVKSFKFNNPVKTENTGLQKSTNLDYGDSFIQNNMLGIPVFHDNNINGNGILIAMFDTGFKTSHEALQSVNVLATWDFVENDSDVTGYPGETHGAQTLGVIAGYSPGNLIGPAYGADYILAKTDDYNTETHRDEDNWVAAAEWADSLGADIIASSVGYNWFDPGEYDYTYEDMDGNTAITTIAADMAAKKGIAVFNSAGNEGNNNWQHIIAPADGDSVFAIGNVNSSGILSSSSSRGPTYDGRLKPDFVAMGTSVRTVSTINDNSYSYVSGTSYSAPLAAGAGALVLSYNNTLAPMQLYNILKMYASNSNFPNNDIGYGIINIAPLIEGDNGDTESPINLSRNPFSDYITINLNYQADKNPAIYNLLGQKIKSFKKENINLIWYGESENNNKVASGVYIFFMVHNNQSYAKKMVLIR